MKKKTKTKKVAPAPAVDDKRSLTIDVAAIDEMFSVMIGTLMALQALLQLITTPVEEVEP